MIGGVFIKMLEDPATWKKWSSRDQAKVGGWAPAPVPPRITEIVPTSEHKPAVWRYTFKKPAGDWAGPDFDDSQWKQGPGGFGTTALPARSSARPGTRRTSGSAARWCFPRERIRPESSSASTTTRTLRFTSMA